MRFDVLLLGGFLAFLVNIVGLSHQSRVFLRRSPAPLNQFPYRQASIKRKLNERHIAIGIGTPTAPHHDPFRPAGPLPPATATAPQPNTKQNQPNPNQNNRAQSYFKRRIFMHFQECHLGVRVHVQKITSICSGHITQESAKKISWDLLLELQAILTLCLTCARKIKSCTNTPIPSSLPGIPENPPSVHDIGQMIFQLLLQLKVCFNEMNQVCSRFEIIRMTCSDCLVQISSAASASLSVSGSHIGGLLVAVTRLFGGDPLSFFGLHRFGLDSILKILI
ncbi:hypothetical protein PCANC_09164 [Puccinia coronata f. sp. avenae]|uniref:Uncharacterized protein n=1 Tax=Puccinia coronata f. sp. avenae TaxID=200324 RepID=A0A2N5T212_9BASI|nr:hypothetical protein PCASD_18944 [Puccinia coronata f. sp. avenae]PLW39746.1 hypothetical protein PCASD_09613 [Puccinia coronata f. sp. avenae]PLW53876.1 hypothetical protein PCANC_09164 [Puccinia coronata f. sp. avenae]